MTIPTGQCGEIGDRAGAGPFGDWRNWLLFAIFLVFFTARLVPEPVADRSIYQSVAERMIAGDRLYVDVIDNKDPLFYYAVAAQRLIGPLAEYGCELVWVLGSALIAARLAGSFGEGARLIDRVVLVGAAFMVSGPFYDLGGTIPPGIFLSLLTIWLAWAGRGVAAGLALAALLFTKLIYAPIALTFVLVSTFAGAASGRGARAFLLRGGLACLAASAAVLLILVARGEWPGYLEAQRANLLYSSSNVFVAPNLLANLADHVLTALYFGKAFLFVSLLFFAFLLHEWRVTPTPDPRRTYLGACLATYPVSLGLVCLTAIWGPHLAVLDIFLALGGAAAVPALLTRYPRALAYPVLAGLFWILSGIAPGNWLVVDPAEFAERLDALTAAPPEAVALHQVAGAAQVRYARLGSDNDLHHASGTRAYKLVCPRFFQYRFTEPTVLAGILDCASKADYLIVDFPEDHPLAPGNFVTPVADFAMLNGRWSRFTAAAEAMLRRNFRCVQGEDTLSICKRIGSLPAERRGQ